MSRAAEFQLTREQARLMLLMAQGLEAIPGISEPPRDPLAAIQQMNLLQIDTISVVARSPYLVLWSRLGDYEPAQLDQLLSDGAIFECWSHAACFAPISDYVWHMAHRQEPTAPRTNRQKALTEMRTEADRILALVRENGPVRSTDFSRESGRSSGWWDWKPEKMTLELLLMNGELMIARRDGFQRIYDLSERVHPGILDLPIPTVPEARHHFMLETVRALGVSTATWTPDYYRMLVGKMSQELERGVDQLELFPIEIDSVGRGFVHESSRSLVETVIAGNVQPGRTTILSPFDPIVWHRRRATELFDFDYLIECYTPAAKRIYGYFTLPILHRGTLVGRIDAKAHRKHQILEIKSVHFEPSVLRDETLLPALAITLADFARWHRTSQVLLMRTEPDSALKPLHKYLSKEIETGR